MVRRSSMFAKPLVVVSVPLERLSSKFCRSSLDEPVLAKRLQSGRIITATSKNLDVEETQ
jgi:hypothetical protein